MNVYERSQLMRAMNGIMEREKYAPLVDRPSTWREFYEALLGTWPGPVHQAEAVMAECAPPGLPRGWEEAYVRLPHDASFDSLRPIVGDLIKTGWVRGFIWPPWSTLAWVHKDELDQAAGDLVLAWRSAVRLGAT